MKTLVIKSVIKNAIKNIAFLSIILMTSIAYSQGVVVTESSDVTEPHESALFEVFSTNKGILIPRMSTDDRNAIVNPANGLLVYDDTENHFFYYDSQAKDGAGGWVKAMSGDAIGTGAPGRVAFWETESTIGSSPYMIVKDDGFVQVTSKDEAGDDDPIFEVRNREGHVVLGVYQTGVKIFVDDSEGKTSRGSFAVGGFTAGKDKSLIDYLRVTPDSVRIYVADGDGTGKTSRGGFAVGGFTAGKGHQELFRVTPDSTRIYLDDRPGKTSRGGFAVGGFTAGKSGLPSNFFNIETLADVAVGDVIDEPRILWYPLKNAFLAGQVLIDNPEDIGFNSLSIGYQTRASGDRSQALGYQSHAQGDYSTAIGKNAHAQMQNSFAFGDGAKSLNKDAYAFGTNAEAFGEGSFAFGSMGRDSVDVNNMAPSDIPTRAEGDFSFAFGLGSGALAEGAFALGTNVNAQGPYSVAMGYNSQTNGLGSASMGWGAMAQGALSFSSGFYTLALGDHSIALGHVSRAAQVNSVAIGNFAVADGLGSYAMGNDVVAKSISEFAIGSFNATQGYDPDPYTWVPLDRLFIIGNGVEGMRSNALTILKNGNMGIQDIVAPMYSLHLPNNISPGEGYGRAMATEWLTYSDKRIKSNLNAISYGLDEIMKLKPVEFVHHNSKIEFGKLEIDNRGAKSIGLVAQDVFEIIPEVVSKPINDENDLWGMSYEKLVPVLIKAIQEQQAVIETQNKIIDEQNNAIKQIEERLKLLEE